MEGELLKWTNYFTGWQPRWFILNNGVLSYYKSQEDVANGCKGSIKMAVCDIAVHPTDMTRLDLTIPGEQFYYVKASTPQDRQSWLIALGSSKAAYTEFTSSAKKNADVPDMIRTKQSELRLYCDLLIQQVHSVKQMASKSDGLLNVEKLTESTSLIVATCDTFILTLEDCMKLVSNTPVLESTHHHVLEAAIPVSPSLTSVQAPRPVTAGTFEKPTRRRPSSISSLDGIKVHTSSSHHLPNGGSSPTQPESYIQPPMLSHPSVHMKSVQFSSVSPVASKVESSPLPSSLPSTPQEKSVFTPMTNTVNGITPQQYQSNGHFIKNMPDQMNLGVPSPSTASDLDNFDGLKNTTDEDIETFFSTMPTSFADVDTSQEDCILIIPFLEACKNLVPIFDKLNTSALTPVKMDFCGNIKKIEHKHESSSVKFLTLQDLVLNEVKNNQHTHSDSATSALLWLKRSLEFIAEFLKECCSDCTDMDVCAGKAYSRTLKLYHGWIVRGIFSVAVRALPYRETFISHLSAGHTTDTTSPHFEQALLKHIKIFVLHLSRVLEVLGNFYIRNALDSSNTV